MKTFLGITSFIGLMCAVATIGASLGHFPVINEGKMALGFIFLIVNLPVFIFCAFFKKL